jgi:TPR repeat protein
MANLLGQLGFSANANIALPLLRKAASYATVDDPLPAYIYGMLLAGELDLGANVTSSITPNLLLDENGRTQEARPWIERSAYLGYAPAQFKMGFNYEYATMGCGYDPLLSVQYYSLASQQGDIEADMA